MVFGCYRRSESRDGTELNELSPLSVNEEPSDFCCECHHAFPELQVGGLMLGWCRVLEVIDYYTVVFFASSSSCTTVAHQVRSCIPFSSTTSSSRLLISAVAMPSTRLQHRFFSFSYLVCLALVFYYCSFV